ncbi:MAG: hypothetical protein WBW33_32210 [Bryobacteraceae bacterium]
MSIFSRLDDVLEKAEIRLLTRAVALKTGVVDLGTGSLCPHGVGLR